MLESGDLCRPASWCETAKICYLFVPHGNTERRARHYHVLLFIRWIDREFSDQKQIAQFMLSDGTILMLYNGEFEKL